MLNGPGSQCFTSLWSGERGAGGHTRMKGTEKLWEHVHEGTVFLSRHGVTLETELGTDRFLNIQHFSLVWEAEWVGGASPPSKALECKTSGFCGVAVASPACLLFSSSQELCLPSRLPALCLAVLGKSVFLAGLPLPCRPLSAFLACLSLLTSAPLVLSCLA